MVYVLPDIHGNERRFDSILKQIDLQAEDVLYVLGDVIDRHAGGIKILRRIMAAENIKMVLGNHEYMMLDALGHSYDSTGEHSGELDEEALTLWYRNGGKVTHDYLKHLKKNLRAEIIQFLLSLPLNIDVTVGEKVYTLTHSASVDDFIHSARYPTEAQFAVWNRWKYASFPHRKSILVFGHTPTSYYQSFAPMRIVHGDNCIGVDCGSGYPEEGSLGKMGRLACIRLDDGKEFYSFEN